MYYCYVVLLVIGVLLVVCVCVFSTAYRCTTPDIFTFMPIHTFT